MLAGLRNLQVRRQAPVARLAEPLARRPPLWPTVSIVLLLCAGVMLTPLLVTILNSMLLSLAVAIVLLGNKPIDRPLWQLVVPFGLISFFGLATGVGADRYEYFKDLWYVLNPLVVILTGYVLFVAKPDLSRGLRAFVIAGLIIAAWQLRGYFVRPDIILLPAATIRAYIGTGFYAPVLALVILIVYAGRWKEDLKLHAAWGWLILTVLALAVAGVFSRAAVLVLAIGVLAHLGAFARREWLRVGLPLFCFIVTVFIIEQIIDTKSDQALLNFGAKLVRSVSEIMIADYSAARDVNINFRGFESRQALNQFGDSGVLAMLFGQGFGAMVDLGISLPLGLSETGGRYTRLIGVLHNGFLFLLTKVGLVGLLLFVYVLGFLYFTGKGWARQVVDDERRRAGRLLQAIALTLAATTYIIAGVFNKFDMFPFLLATGYLLAYVHRLGKPPELPARTQPLAGGFAIPTTVPTTAQEPR